MKKFVRILSISTLGIIFCVIVFLFYKNFQTTNNKTIPSNKIPSSTPTLVATPTSTEEVRTIQAPAGNIKILFVGDTMLARSIGERQKLGVDPFELMEPVFENYDAVIANLETTVSDKGQKVSGKTYTFRAPVESVDFLTKAGVKAVSLANNHTKDYGDEALVDTITRLNNANILNFGAGNNKDEAFAGKVLDVDGVRIGLLGFNEIENGWTVSKTGPTSAWTDLPKIKQEITRLKSESDIVMVMPHWGKEYSTMQNTWQIKLGHILIDAGADAVIGSHPHVIEPSEVYNGKPIYYSMGNFVFDQMQNITNATDGEIVEVNIIDKKISSTNAFRIKIGKDGRPALASGDAP